MAAPPTAAVRPPAAAPPGAAPYPAASAFASYPLEYRTPPLPLVALVGCAHVQKEVAEFFMRRLRPPLVSLFTPAEGVDAVVARSFVPPKHADADAAVAAAAAELGPPPGLIKSDWLSKHRSRRPAAALALVTQRELADGDPTSMLAMLQAVRDATSKCGVGFIVGVLQAPADARRPLPPGAVTGACQALDLLPRM